MSAIANKRFSDTSELEASENEISSQRISPGYTKMILYPAMLIKVVNSNRK